MGNARNIAFWVVLFLLVLALFNLFSGGQTTMSQNARSYSDFVAAVQSGTVARPRAALCRKRGFQVIASLYLLVVP